jgi:S1-C subfamily serine protease
MTTHGLTIHRGAFAAQAMRIALVAIALLTRAATSLLGGEALSEAIGDNPSRMVKIYGAGGPRGLEPYQSGFLISAEGHILTVWSYVLDSDYINATLADGRRMEAKVLGADPRLEMAVLKIDATDLPHFDLAAAVPADGGTRVLAMSNLFGVATGDEADSVQHGVIAVKTRLDARRGAFESPYRGPVYVLDAMTNNPGAAGGALLNLNGELVAMLGKELRSASSNIWLNYAVPIDELRTSAEQIVAGKFRPTEDKPTDKPAHPVDLAALGMVLVPDILERTPPYVDTVRGGSPAETAGVKPDDLVVFLNDALVNSCKGFGEELGRLERDAELRVVLMRGQELVEVVIKSVAEDVSEK